MTFPLNIPHTDYDVTNALKRALGDDTSNEYESIASFVGSLLEARGFSNEHYFRVFERVSQVNSGTLSTIEFAQWFTEMYPASGNINLRKALGLPHHPDNPLGALLFDLRLKAGLTRTQLAAALVVAPSQVARWENGETEPSNPTYLRLGSILNINPAHLWAAANKVEV
jgi:DNA-binding XRE family transcriptional regulator